MIADERSPARRRRRRRCRAVGTVMPNLLDYVQKPGIVAPTAPEASAVQAEASGIMVGRDERLAWRCRQGLRAAQLGGDRQLADLLAHLLPDYRRESIMEAGVDARLRNLVAVVLHRGPSARDA